MLPCKYYLQHRRCKFCVRSIYKGRYSTFHCCSKLKRRPADDLAAAIRRQKLSCKCKRPPLHHPENCIHRISATLLLQARAHPRYVPPPDFSDLQCTCETTWCPLPYGLRLGTAVWDHYARKFQNEDSSESVSSSETPTHGQVPTRQKGFMPDWFYAAANKHMHLTGEVDNTQSVSCKAPQKKTMACFSPLLDTSCAYWCNRSTHPTVIPSPSSVRTTRTRTQRPRPPRPGQTPLSTRQSPRAQHSQTRPPQQTGSQTVAQTPQTVDLSPATRASTQQQPQGARSSLQAIQAAPTLVFQAIFRIAAIMNSCA